MNPKINFLLNKSLEALEGLNLEVASLYLKQVIKLQSTNAHALRLLGVIAAQRKQYLEALDFLNASLRSLPKNPLTLSNLGNVFFDLKEYNNALESYDKAIKLEPKYDEAWSNKGNVLHELKRYDEALAHHEKALSLNPNYAAAWSNKGNTLNELKRYDEAIEHYDQALSLRPDYAEGWSNKANTLNELKRYEEALALLDRSLTLKPDNVEALSNKGNALSGLKLLNEAALQFNEALSLNPNYAAAWSNKGNVLRELKRYDEAIVHFEKAFELNPQSNWLQGDLIHAKMNVCNWDGLEEDLHTISQQVNSLQKIITPFSLLALTDDAMLHKKSSNIYVQDRIPLHSSLGPILKRPESKKIRIGYFSADFHNHATSHLMAELFELHDKNIFELFGFSFGPITNGEMRQRLEKSFDQFIEVGDKTDSDIAQLSRNLNIDIAVDLKGFTQDSRSRIFSYRAAPIQVNYLGYPSTSGAEYIDYIIADKIIIPNQLEQWYSEKVVRLPHCYQANDRKRVIADKKFTKQDLGLPENGIVFCCFNNNFKIMPATFDGWMRILKAVEGSVLWLLEDNSWALENLKIEAQKRGVEPNRLVFAKRLSPPEHLARHQQADLFLDTFPCNAHTTASDALWAGLPLLTLMGESFASRVAASLLNAIELPELVTISQSEYESLAIELAKNPLKLDRIKQKLAQNRLTTPLFDTPLFTKNIEAAYIEMHQRNQLDL